MVNKLATLAVVVSLAAVSFAQETPVTAAPAAPPAAPKTQEEVKLDPAAEAWLKVLGGKIADTNEVVRNSSQQGIISIGRPALAYLRTLAESSDQAVAAEAKKVIERIERGRGPGGGPMGNMAERMKSELGLNADQEKKVNALLEANRKKMQEVFSQMQDENLTPEERRAAMSDLRSELEKELKDVLSEEQFKKYQETMRNTRWGGGGQGGQGGGQGGGEGGGRRRRGGGGG